MRGWPFDRSELTLIACGCALIVAAFVLAAFNYRAAPIVLIVGVLMAGVPFGARML